jgi:hypothetical protein
MGTRNKSNNLSGYPSTMTVTDVFHEIHPPLDKTSTVTARGSTVVSGRSVSQTKINFKKFHFDLPTLFFEAV